MRNNSCVGVVWHDRKHYCGFPLSSVRYEISDDRLIYSSGFLNQQQKQLQLYLIQDLTVTRTLGQRVCGVGTVVVTTVDKRIIELVNIRTPFAVKELLYGFMEEQKEKKRLLHTVYLGRRPDWFT